VEALFGDVIVLSGADIDATGAGPDGDGGEIFVSARGTVEVRINSVLSVRGEGSDSIGGEILIDAGLDLAASGVLDASGGSDGGDTDISAGRNITLAGSTLASGRYYGGYGGAVGVAAGLAGSGSVSILGTIDTDGGPCGIERGCGAGGFTYIDGWSVSVASTARLSSQAFEGGEHSFSAREQLTILGSVDAARTNASGVNGRNEFLHRIGRSPVVSGTVVPAAIATAHNTCTAPAELNCLPPCPTCGNGIVEFPETCDNGGGTPISCDGCSVFCRLENCNDGNTCTSDSCDPVLGCRNVPTTAPCTPGPTPTITLTRTPSLTPSPTRSPTRTPTRTHTPTRTPSATPTRTLTPDPVLTPAPTAGMVICSGGATINGPLVRLSRLSGPLGDEGIIIKGVIAFGPGVPAIVGPSSKGAQIRLDDLGSGSSAIFELSYLTNPVPPGPPGTGCGTGDGWKSNASGKHLYRNRSGAIDPPACTSGSANGLSLLKFNDQRAVGKGIRFVAKAKNAFLPIPQGPLRFSVVLGATAAASDAGECGAYVFSRLNCGYNGSGTTMTCR
jgi:cysteine-rich repeat protein